MHIEQCYNETGIPCPVGFQYTSRPPIENRNTEDYRDRTSILVQSINKTTSISEFLKTYNELKSEYPNFTLDAIASNGGYTPLYKAAKCGNSAVIEAIIELGGTILFSRYTGLGGAQSSLYAAIECEDIENGYNSVKKIIELGASVNITYPLVTSWSDEVQIYLPTPLEFAISENKFKIAELLWQNGAKRSPETRVS